MKKLMLITMLLNTSGSAFASPTPNVSPSPGPGDTSNEIAAQMAITRRGVDELLKKTGESTVPSSLKVADYWEVTPTFRKNVENALTRFEESLKKDILETNVAPIMNNYNAIANSTSISGDQKSLILQQQKAFVEGQAKRIEAIYAKTVEQAYLDTGLKLYAMHFPTISNPNKSIRKICNVGKVTGFMAVTLSMAGADPSDFAFCSSVEGFVREYSKVGDENEYMFDLMHNSNLTPAYIFNYVPQIVQIVVNQFRNGCRSQLCVSLRASDAITALTQMQSLFSRNLEMKLADGTSFTIRAPAFRWWTTILAAQAANLYKIDDLPFDTN